MTNKFHKHYNSNEQGRDFIVGDLQGCYTPLMNALSILNFDQSIDRLFCVGDLIDRGTESIECASLVYEKWFHTVQGNHEQMMYRSLIDLHSAYVACWMENGGLWFKDEDRQLLYDLALHFQDLPYVISVGENENRFNIVHAELIKNSSSLITNQDIDNWTFDDKEIDKMLWGRTIVTSRTTPMAYTLRDHPEPIINYQSNELSLTYVGHSIVPFRPVQIEQQIYLDTGCVKGFLPKNIKFQDRYPLTLACPQEQMCYCYVPGWRNINKYPYDKIRYYK